MNEERVLKKLLEKIKDRRDGLFNWPAVYPNDQNAEINCKSLARELLGIMKAEELEPYFEYSNLNIYFRDPSKQFGDWIITNGVGDIAGKQIAKTLNDLLEHLRKK